MTSGKTRVVIADHFGNGSSLWVFYGACMLLSLFLHIPAMMLAVDHYHSFAVFWLWFIVIEGARLGVFVAYALWKQRPAALFLLTEFSISPRVFLPAAMLLFAYARAPLGIFVAVVAFWIVLEVRALRAARAINPYQALRQMRRKGALVEVTPQNWVYYSPKNKVLDLVNASSKGGTFMKTELKYVGLPFALIAPALFLISQRSGADFDLRTLIAGAFAVVIGWLTLPVLVQCHISREALNRLSTEGKIVFEKRSALRSE